ncbi:MAG: hypothetical protein ACRD0A_04510 [Acidimicrobiales bacterium]
MVHTLVRLQVWWWSNRAQLGERFRDDGGYTYGAVIMIAFAVTTAIAVGVLLMNVFISKAGTIDPNAPAGP